MTTFPVDETNFTSIDDVLVSRRTSITSNQSDYGTAPLHSGPCGYASTKEAPEWFLLDSSRESAKRILGMVMTRGDAFCNQTLGSIRRGPKGGDGAWMLDGRDCAVNVENSDPTLLDIIQRHFLPESRVSLGSGAGSATTYPVLNHRVAIYHYTNEGPPPADGQSDEPSGGWTRGGLVEVTDILSLSDITRFLMRWNHIEHCLTPCTVGDLGVGCRAGLLATFDNTQSRADMNYCVFFLVFFFFTCVV